MTTPAYPSRAKRKAQKDALTAYNAQGRAVRVVVPGADVPDELNPAYVFSTTATALLVALASGEISAQALAIDQLANRGLHATTGQWVGFEMARKVADALKAQHGIL